MSTTTRQQTIADQIYAARAEQQAAYMNYRRTGNTAEINAADRKVARLQCDMYDAAALINSKFCE
jgi:hypothetical protein